MAKNHLIAIENIFPVTIVNRVFSGFYESRPEKPK